MFFVDNFYPVVDGVTKVVESYGKILHGKGHTVTLVTSDMKGYKHSLPFQIIEGRTTKKQFFGYYAPKKDRALRKKAESLILQSKPDVIHLHSPLAVGKLGLRLAKKYKIPGVITFHSQFKRDFLRYTRSRLITYFLVKHYMRVYNGADAALTMNEACRQVFKGYGYRGELRIVPNATGFACEGREQVKELAAACDKEYGLENKKNVMLFAGRLAKTKNIYFIARALGILNRKGFEFTFIFAGDGPDRRECERLCNEYGLNDRVIFLGRVEHERLPALYARAELILFPSLYDTNSLVQIEGAAFYTPALFLKGAVTADTVTPEINGFVAENDAEKYAQKVIEILSDEQKLRAAGDAAHKQLYVRWETAVEQAETVYYSFFSQLVNSGAGAVYCP